MKRDRTSMYWMYLLFSAVCLILPLKSWAFLWTDVQGLSIPLKRKKQKIFWNMWEILIFHQKTVHICIGNASIHSKIQIQNLIQQVGTSNAHFPGCIQHISKCIFQSLYIYLFKRYIFVKLLNILLSYFQKAKYKCWNC